MATLTGKTIASTYTSLLKLEGDSGSTVTGADGNAVQVKTGDDDATPLYLNTDRIGIGTASPSDVLTVHGNFKINTTNTDGNESRFKIAPGGDSDDCIVSIYDDNQTETIILDASGKVGIGTSSPAQELEVVGDIAVMRTSVSATRYVGITQSNGDMTNSTASIGFISDGTDQKISFSTHNSGSSSGVRMLIDEDGNVGIGTTNPGYLLDVKNASGTAVARIHAAGSSQSAQLLLQNDQQIWNINCQTSDKFAIYDDTDNTERLVIDTDGNVGIGTAAPNKSSYASDNTVLTIAGNSADGYSILEMGSYNTDGDDDLLGGISFCDNMGSGTLEVNAAIYAHRDAAYKGRLTFFTSDETSSNQTVTERMRIDPDGNVGIGSTSPSTRLTVAETTANENVEIKLAGKSADGSDRSGILGYCPDDNTTANNYLYLTGSGNPTLVVRHNDNVGIGTASPSTTLHIEDNPNDVVMFADNDQSSGNVYIAKYKFSGRDPNDTTSYFLSCEDSANKLRIYSNGDVYTATGTNIQPLSSDERMKTSIQDYTGGLAIVNSLKPRTYEWKPGRGETGIKYGFISQEIQAISDVKPEMNLYSKRTIEADDKNIDLCPDGIINTTQLSAKDTILISAIQELSAKVTALESA